MNKDTSDKFESQETASIEALLSEVAASYIPPVFPNKEALLAITTNAKRKPSLVVHPYNAFIKNATSFITGIAACLVGVIIFQNNPKGTNSSEMMSVLAENKISEKVVKSSSISPIQEIENVEEVSPIQVSITPLTPITIEVAEIHTPSEILVSSEVEPISEVKFETESYFQEMQSPILISDASSSSFEFEKVDSIGKPSLTKKVKKPMPKFIENRKNEFMANFLGLMYQTVTFFRAKTIEVQEEFYATMDDAKGSKNEK